MLADSKEKKGTEKRINPNWYYLAGILLISIVVFYQFLFSNGMFYSSDQMGGLDSKVFLKDALARFHQLPMWFNSRLAGMPSIDAMFGDPFYLPSLIFNSLFSVPRAVGMKMIFHIFLAGVFFFYLMRKGFGSSGLIAFTGALLFMFNPQFLSHIYPGHDGKMYVIAWIPFVVWRLKELIGHTTLKNVSLLSLGISMIFLTSHIQMSYFALWGLGFMWVFALIFKIQEKRIAEGIKLSAFFWLAIAVALLVGIIQIVPSYMYIQKAFSVRGVDKGIDFAASWSLHWGEVFSLWIPEFVNSLEYYWGQNPFKLNSEYGGGVALLLSVFALISKPSKWRFFWAGVAVFAVGFGLGAHSIVWTIAYYIAPGVAKFRAASMIMFWFSFATVLLAVLFLKDLTEGRFSTLSDPLRKKWITGLAITAGAFLLVTLVFSNASFVKGLFVSGMGEKERVFDINFTEKFIPSLWLWFFGVISVLALLFATISQKVKPSTAVIGILILGLIDILRVDYQFIKMVDSRPYLYTEPALKELQLKMAQEPFRCFSLPGALPQNSEGIHGLEGVGGFHDNELRWYREFRGDQQDRNYLSTLVEFNEKGQAYLNAEKLALGSAFLDLANVRYLLVRSQNQLVAVENRNALGRVSFAPNFIVMDSSRIVSALKNSEYDYRTTIALQQEPSVKPIQTDSTESVNFKATWEKYSPNIRIVDVVAPENGFLRISEAYYPGWHVLVDNKTVQVLRADQTWMALPITKGEHKVEMRISSLYLGKVAWISIVTFITLLVYIGIIGIRDLKKSSKR